MSDDELIVGWDIPGEPQTEDRFFKPTERCPHPERWTATDGDSTEVEVSEFIGALVRVMQPDIVVETGTAFGGTTVQIAKALGHNGRGFLYTIENNPERVSYLQENHNPSLIAFRYRWTLIEGSSLDWLPPIGQQVDLLFCDTARDIRLDEILHFHPCLRRGGIVGIHDSGWDLGPLRGWIENSLVKTGVVRAIDLPTPRGLTLCEVL